MEWEDLGMQPFDVSGEDLGWGVHGSSNIKLWGKSVLKLSIVYGEGIENYMNDAPADVGVVTTEDPADPIDGAALPVLGIVAFADLYWNDQFSSSVGYSFVDIGNSDGQSASAFEKGHYALANLLWTPKDHVMFGGELQWGRRDNASDGFDSDDFRIQFSFKYSYSLKLGGE
jgi:hypothetical protein